MWWILAVALVLILFARRDREESAAGTILLVVLVLFAAGAASMMGMGHHGSFGFWGPWYGGWAWLRVVGSVLAMAAFGIVAYLLLRPGARTNKETDEILRLRLARGEITPEQFDALKAKLDN